MTIAPGKDFGFRCPWKPEAIGIAVFRLETEEEAARAVTALEEQPVGVERIRRVQACHGA